MTYIINKLKQMNAGEIAIGTLIGISALIIAAIGGSYAYTETRSIALAQETKKVEEKLQTYMLEKERMVGELKSEISSINTKLDLILKFNGIKP